MGKVYKSFETERLFIRPVSEEDAAFIFELLNCPKWIKFIGDRNIRSVNDAKAYINRKMRPQLEKLGFSNYTVIRKSDGVKLGTCGLYDRDGLEGVDIGFAFLPKFEKKGYAFESASRMKEAAFNDFNITKLSAITLPENTASRNLLSRLGLKFVKMIRLPNDSEDLLLYVLPDS